ncbi:MAG: hypothetical protein JWM16_3828 [Verrucomicrobiales bacterium]|nr:hypothetical protein [Verrucomicrobiales bacterium]
MRRFLGGYDVLFRDTLLCFLALLAATVAQGVEPFLSRANHTNGQLRFSLNGECKAGYIVLATTNFSDWIPVATNRAFASIRSISFAALDNQAFFKVQSVPTSPFSFAVAMKNGVDFNGNNFQCDSYNKDLGDYGMNILWPLPMGTNIQGSGDILAKDLINNFGPIGNAKIVGHVLTAPGGAIAIGPNGSIGDLQWGGANGIKPGWVIDDTNYPMLEVSQPWTGVALAAAGSGAYRYVLSTGKYEINGDLILNSTNFMFVKGNASLWVKGNVDIDSNAYIKMNGSGYRLSLYCTGNIRLAGTWDKSIDPLDLCIYGLPTCTNIAMTTGSKMEAVVYAPQANVTFFGTADLRGAIVANSLTLNGNAAIHYDESLARRVLR